MSNPINAYPSVFSIGHQAVSNIFDGYVVVEEKIDGSQFSFGLINGELVCRSKGKRIIPEAPEKMFEEAVETAKELKNSLHPGWVYRCEYLRQPKHNTLAYDRIPKKYLVLFDVMIGEQAYLPPLEMIEEANRLGLEAVPVYYHGVIYNPSTLGKLLEKPPLLGGLQVEGIVIKNYNLFTPEKKIAVCKLVSECFLEKHEKDWKKRNPGSKDIVQMLIEEYRTEARWQKAVQHLRDDGQLEQSPRDIGLLLQEIPADIHQECQEEIKQKLFDYAWPKIKRGVTAGFPEWYKQQLSEGQSANE